MPLQSPNSTVANERGLIHGTRSSSWSFCWSWLVHWLLVMHLTLHCQHLNKLTLHAIILDSDFKCYLSVNSPLSPQDISKYISMLLQFLSYKIYLLCSYLYLSAIAIIMLLNKQLPVLCHSMLHVSWNMQLYALKLCSTCSLGLLTPGSRLKEQPLPAAWCLLMAKIRNKRVGRNPCLKKLLLRCSKYYILLYPIGQSKSYSQPLHQKDGEVKSVFRMAKVERKWIFMNK